MMKFNLSVSIFLIVIFTNAFGKKAKVLAFIPKTFKAQVEQVVVSSLSDKGKKTKTYGTIEYKYPGNFRYEEKDKIVFVANKNKSWYYTPPFIKGQPGDLQLDPMKGKFPLSMFFDALTRGLNSNKLYKVKKLKKAFKLVFNDKFSKRMGFGNAILVFKSSAYLNFEGLKTVQITKLNGKKVTFNMLSIKRDVQFGSKRFIFTPPANTKISQ